MFAYLIPLLGAIIGLIGIGYILVRKARFLPDDKREFLVYPEITTEKSADADGARNAITAEHAVLTAVEKFFRKARIRLMRLENWLGKITNKLHERRSRKKDFFGEEEGSKGAQEAEKASRDTAKGSFVAFQKQDEKFDEEYWINILKHDSSSAYPYKKLGEIYTAREDFKEARAVLKYALKLDSSDEEARSLMESLRGKRTPNQSRLRRHDTGQARRKTQNA